MSDSAPRKSPELAELKKEVAALKKELAKLRKDVEAGQKPGKLRAKAATVESLEIVDGSGRVVAAVDKKGNLFCRSVWVAEERGKRGVFIDGVKHRKISAGRLELIGLDAANPSLEASGEGAGVVHLRDPQSKQQVLLQGAGSALIAQNAESGETTVVLACNGPDGGHLNLRSAVKGSKARAVIGISHATKAGAILLTDEKNQTVGKLPNPPPEQPVMTVS